MKRNSETVLTEWLVINAQMGDEKALEQLLRVWYPKLIGYASRLLEDEHLANDAIQNALLDMCRNIKKIKDPAAFPKWIFKILQNKCADSIKHLQKERHKARALEASQYLEIEKVELLDNTPEVDLSNLDNNAYQLVYLHYFEEFTLTEISHIVGLPVGTLKSRLHGIRQKLKLSNKGH
ncbi:RNA polymerase sigma factor [Aliiglaciecola sp. 3_MG-2023]|uniref:RNA polymerase sigma factor n=1 Tax=Aliiglaciecola TaxID=1406885 RepID=UPI001C085459|nr:MULTISPECIES: RNA polymerase sigma factor [Aliiglaciecola]MBU2878586.1 RNA polymerase sigma factor [Aliiglaciecola lipolytica]MDO6692111.1 RNA polymerase sigma factor [Aliiglaciecola sp. 3_MG-2023]MDO6709585.1 RNA polymerase sigma factor [Aliiglaciecola sp. 2_MG-2023]MDO6750873.1 RNA polymerase sigma factor [Aliiglaciecola sp. 1_MG-2023]